ncbi:predicted protein [Histoplasma capsulatum H143]|uniref:Uncharacterized protein n=1 Tax=Ajellomyces capsulatus (strain H143) TaxID=544712 RepID=C6HFL9_AJECH|nr:predicted protein [Histoplasma capsulatum H143]
MPDAAFYPRDANLSEALVWGTGNEAKVPIKHVRQWRVVIEHAEVSLYSTANSAASPNVVLSDRQLESSDLNPDSTMDWFYLLTKIDGAMESDVDLLLYPPAKFL